MEIVDGHTEYMPEWQKNRLRKEARNQRRTAKSQIRTQIRNKKPVEIRAHRNKQKINRSKVTDESEMGPVFYSKTSLLSQDLEAHIGPMIDYQKERNEFIKYLHYYLVNHEDLLNLSTFHNEELNWYPLPEKKFQYKMEECEISDFDNIRIAAIDGGLGFEHFQSVNLTLIKVGGALYEFSKGKTSFTKIPNTSQGEESFQNEYCFYLDNGIELTSEHESQKASLRREIAEITTILNFIKSEPRIIDFVLLDGSILPPPWYPSYKKAPQIDEYHRMCVQKYNELYSVCEQKKIYLIGSIKETRSTGMRDQLLRSLPYFIRKYSDHPKLKEMRKFDYRKILSTFTDTELIDKLLSAGTRTTAFLHKVIESIFYPNNHLLQEQLGGGGNEEQNIEQYFIAPQYNYLNYFDLFQKKRSYGVYVSYLQISQYDFPLRIEFLSPTSPKIINKRVNFISKILNPLSKINKECAIPLPQIEAHLKAHLSTKEFDILISQFKRKFQTRTFASLKYPNPQSFNAQLDQKTALNTFKKRRHHYLDKLF